MAQPDDHPPAGSLLHYLLTLTTQSVAVVLFDETPLHRDNFIKLVEKGKYDGVLFHRVIKDFMIQGGDLHSKHAQPGQRLGSGDYTCRDESAVPAAGLIPPSSSIGLAQIP